MGKQNQTVKTNEKPNQKLKKLHVMRDRQKAMAQRWMAALVAAVKRSKYSN